MLLDRLKAYGWMALAILLAIMLLIQTSRLHTTALLKKSVEHTLATEQRDGARRLAEAQAAARVVEQDLQLVANVQRKEANAQIKTLNAQHVALLTRVRAAEARAARHLSQVSATAGTGETPSGDSNAELLGTFGSEDVAEATRANAIRINLIQCYTQYDAARDLLSK